MANARVTGIAVDCPDPKALCTFYSALLGIEPAGDDAVVIAKGDQGNLELWFQPVENYVPPTWPTQERGQQIHLDFVTEDIGAAVAYAESLGATRAPAPPEDDFTVMLDPAGHPFCIAAPFTGLEDHARRREIARDGAPTITLAGVNIDCPDMATMIRFMIGLTGMEYHAPEGELPKLLSEDGLLFLFQEVEEYQPPTWPTQERGQQLHLDIEVDDREAMVARAIELGAHQVDVAERFTVMLDPAGHPFCLCDSR